MPRAFLRTCTKYRATPKPLSIPFNELPFQIQEAEENFTNHLKINQDKYLPKEDISLDDVVITEKVTNLTTFAAQSGLKKVPCPVVPTALVSQEIIPPSSEPVKGKEKVEGKLSSSIFYFSLLYLFHSGIQYKKNGLKTQKMHFLPVIELM